MWLPSQKIPWHYFYFYLHLLIYFTFFFFFNSETQSKESEIKRKRKNGESEDRKSRKICETVTNIRSVTHGSRFRPSSTPLVLPFLRWLNQELTKGISLLNFWQHFHPFNAGMGQMECHSIRFMHLLNSCISSLSTLCCLV